MVRCNKTRGLLSSDHLHLSGVEPSLRGLGEWPFVLAPPCHSKRLVFLENTSSTEGVVNHVVTSTCYSTEGEIK